MCQKASWSQMTFYKLHVSHRLSQDKGTVMPRAPTPFLISFKPLE